MAAPPQPPPIPLQPATIQCLGCQIILQIEVQRPRIVNFETFSLVVFEHPMRIVCPKCSAELVIIVNAIPGLGLAGKPISKPLVQVPEKHLLIPS